MGSSRRLIYALVAAVALLVPASAHAAFPGANGKIAFDDVYTPPAAHISTINPDGTGATVLAVGGDAAWSADGHKLAYINSADHVATMNADGSGQTDLGVGPTTGGIDLFADLHDPAWSPDGRQIAFTEFVEYPDASYQSFVWIVNADGSDRHGLLPPRENFGFSPSWSPDGQWIAFAGGCGICKVHPDGTGLTAVFTGTEDDALSPDWSPDGTEIAFSYTGSIWKVRADGTGLQVIRAGSMSYPFTIHLEPAWSPDGSKMVSMLETPATRPSDVYVMNADGSNETRLAAGQGPSWQPLSGPQRSDYKNAAQFCKGERDFLGDSQFREKYGNGANAYGHCVSAN
jgi:Tol biopolymer transport system component